MMLTNDIYTLGGYPESHFCLFCIANGTDSLDLDGTGASIEETSSPCQCVLLDQYHVWAALDYYSVHSGLRIDP
jgi:hypothetical protein